MTSGGGMGGAVDVMWTEVRARVDENSFRDMEARAAEAGDSAGEQAGGGLKGRLGAALAGLPAMALAAGAAVGAALAAGLKSAVDIAAQVNQGQKDMQASLGVTQQEAEKLGEVAKKVFGNNWGADLAGAQQAVANVRREIQGLSDTDLQAVTEGSIAIAERFEEDQSKVAAAVQSLMKATGMSATEATDFIAAGFQKGLNSSGDFLDTLNEYAPQFEKAKIGGSELFSLLETGAAKGALGTDKVADAFKEMGLTIVEVSDDSKAVYRELGLDQQKIVDQLNAGTMTQAQAFSLITDKLKGVQGEANRTRIAAAIFGGAGEDFGPGLTQLDLTKTKLSDIKGSADTVKDATNTLGSVFQTAWRQVQLQLEPVGQELLKLAQDAMPHVQRAIQQVGPVVQNVVRSLVDGFRQARGAVEQANPIIEKLGDVFQSVFGLIRTLWENVLRPALVAIAPVVQAAFGIVQNVVSTALGVVTGVINAVSALLRGDFAGAWEQIAGVVVGALSGVQRHITEFLPKMLTAGADLGRKIIEGMQRGLDGLQAMMQTALANALSSVADKLPGFLGNLFRGAAQAAAGAAAANTAQASAPTGSGNTPTSTGYAALLQSLGVGGFGLSTDYAGHRGKDVRTPEGTALRAPGPVKVQFGFQQGGYGQFLQLTQEDGSKVVLAHLKTVNQDILNEIKRTGYATVGAGTLLGTTGGARGAWYSQNSTGPHLHAEILAANANLNRYLIGPNPGAVTPPSNGGNAPAPKPAPVTVPLAPVVTAKDIQGEIDSKIKDVQARLSLKLIDTDQAKKELAAIERQATQAGRAGGPNMQAYAAGATAAHSALEALKKTATPTVDVLEALTTRFEYAGKAGLPAYVKGLEAYIAQQDKAAKSAAQGSEAQLTAMGNVSKARKALEDAKKTSEDKEAETDLQRDQRLRRESLAREALARQIRTAGSDRLNQIITTGVTEANTLEKINLAEAELARRKQLTTEAAKKAAAEREKAEKEAEDRAKAISANRLAADRALADGQIKLAQGKAQAVITAYDREVKAAGQDADARLAVEQRLGKDVLAARDTLARASAQEQVTRLERERNAAVNVEGLTLRQRQALWKQYAGQIDGVNRDLTGTIRDNAAASAAALLDLQVAAGQAASEIVDREIAQINRRFQDVQAAADSAYRQSYGVGESGLTNALAALTGLTPEQVGADVDAALLELERLNSGAAAIVKRVYGDVLAEQRQAATESLSIGAMQAEGNKRVADEAVRVAQDMAKGGNLSGAIAYLNEVLGALYDRAADSEDAVDGINTLVNAVNDLAATAPDLGTDPGMGGSTAARGTRTPAPAMTPTAARGTRDTTVTTSTEARGALSQEAAAWIAKRDAQEYARVESEKYRATLKGLTVEQLQALALTATSEAKHAIILDEIKGKTDALTAAKKLMADTEAALQKEASKDQPYQDQIDALEKLRDVTGVNVVELDKLIARLTNLQKLKLSENDLNPGNLAARFDKGRESGDAAGIGSILGVAEGFGKLLSPLNLLGEILNKINPVASIMEGIFSVLAEPLKAIQEPLVTIGTLIGSIIAPVLELFAPILKMVVDIMVAVYDVLAGIVKTVTFGFVNIDRRTPGTSGGAALPAVSPPAPAQTNAQVNIPTSQVTIAAAPEYAGILAAAARDFREGVGEFREAFKQGVKVNAEVKVASGSSNLAWELGTGGV